MLGGSGPWASQTQLGRDRHRVRPARHPVCPLSCPPPQPCQLRVPQLSKAWERGTVSNAPGGSDGWHQALTMPVPSFTPPRVAELSPSPQTPPYPRARGQEGTGHPQAGSACGGAELDVARRGHSSGRREPSRGHGSSSAAPAGPRSPGRAPQPRPHGSPAQPSPRHTGAAPAMPSPCSPRSVPCAQRGCRQSRAQMTRSRVIPARQQDPPFTESGDFSQGSPALALLELAAAMASPPAGSRERRHLSTAPTAPREPNTARWC